MKYKSIIISGPNASGKSDFAHNLAKRINGAIINCDSVQIYRGIENISASPFAGKTDSDFSEIDGVPYRLFSVLDLSEHISVTDYRDIARKAMDEVVAMGKTPIFVGGSGYYINVLVNGISAIPEISDEVRNRARDIVKNSPETVKQFLADIPADPQRTARALEVFLETGKTLSEWQKSPRTGALVPDAYKILVLPERELLLKRIANRIPEMISGGALDEGKYIIENNLNPERAIGAVQICKMLNGEISRDEAIENWVTKTNQYAKRQRTWFRTQYAADFEIPHVPNEQDLEDVLLSIF